MEIDRVLLQTMLREFWLTTHNDICEDATVAFLKRIGLTDREIKEWVEVNPNLVNIKEANDILDEAVKETRNYYIRD